MFTAMILSAMAGVAGGETVKLTLIPTGASAKIGYYMPIRVELESLRPDGISKVPPGLKSPMYGKLPATGPTGSPIWVILDEPEGETARLFVDTNADGDLTNDAAADWKPSNNKMYMGGAMIDIGSKEQSREVHVLAYRFDPNDPQRAALKNSVFFYRDYALEGEVKLGDKSYKAMLLEDFLTGDFRGTDQPQGSGALLMLDVNGNGSFDRRGERFDVKKPFNIGGTTYELSGITKSGEFTVVKSSQTVAEEPTPPDHGPGKKITPFEAKNMDGKAVHFPADYKGKIVMVDFWATWCGPCMAEVPNLVATYDKLHAKGFEVLGVSLDNDGQTDKVKSVLGEKKMTWPQIYEGGGWKTPVATKYAIDSIPQAFLVDGDTGEVIANKGLRGEELEKVILKALQDKNGKN